MCYKYLLENKKTLLLRDNGKTDKYPTWYAYGRKQGMLRKTIGSKIILPLAFLKSKGIYYIEVPNNDNCLVLSGIMVDIEENKLSDFLSIIKSNNFYSFCESNNKILSDKANSNDVWLTITAKTLSNFYF